MTLADITIRHVTIPGPLYFVPDDTVLLNEASCLGIRYSNDLYGGVCPLSFREDESHHSWTGRSSRGAATGLVLCFRRAGAGDRVAGLYRLLQPRWPGWRPVACSRAGPIRLKKTAQCVGKRPDCGLQLGMSSMPCWKKVTEDEDGDIWIGARRELAPSQDVEHRGDCRRQS